MKKLLISMMMVALLATSVLASIHYVIAMSQDGSYGYEGVLVRNGQMYELHLEMIDRTLHIEMPNSPDIHIVALDSSFEGEWVLNGQTIDVSFDESDRTMTFDFPELRPRFKLVKPFFR